MRKAKIGVTLGPATDGARLARRLIAAGVDVARLNFSHGTPEEHRRRVEEIRAAAAKAGRSVAVMADLQGPRFRLGTLHDGPVELRERAEVRLVPAGGRVRDGALPVAPAALVRTVKRGDRILIDDGNVALRVESTGEKGVRCRVERGGVVSDQKGINLPDGAPDIPALTRKDRADLATAVDLGADWLAVSFVGRASHVRSARRLLRSAGSRIPIMAKIERAEALEHLDEIVEEADGILVARGDLGVELPPERVPVLQKRIVEMANARGKPVMTATQMLDSMRHSRRPTRAEVSDVANAVLDGSGCLLLTAETAVGRYPIEAVRMMASIVEQAEGSGRTHHAEAEGPLDVAAAICMAACRAGAEIGARYIIAYTGTGFTARQIARFRPDAPILAYTPEPAVQARLNVLWGVTPKVVARRRDVDELIDVLDAALLEERLVKRGDRIVVLTGSPVDVQGSTNLMKIHAVGQSDTLRRGGRKRVRAV